MTTRYKVVGPTGFQGHKPGDVFDADLDPGLERRAKARGSIRVVKHDTTPPTHEKEETADAEADRTQ